MIRTEESKEEKKYPTFGEWLEQYIEEETENGQRLEIEEIGEVYEKMKDLAEADEEFEEEFAELVRQCQVYIRVVYERELSQMKGEPYDEAKDGERTELHNDAIESIAGFLEYFDKDMRLMHNDFIDFLYENIDEASHRYRTLFGLFAKYIVYAVNESKS